MSKSKRILTNWILTAEESNLPEFNPAITAFRDWYKEICNSKLTPITNGFTEGVNNKIKVLKRVTYGMRNFETKEIEFYICLIEKYLL